ncbi:MAG: hypothetical protein JSU78_03915, partial [Deltaproteobacteria bacterium]
STRSQIIENLKRYYHPEKSIKDVADEFIGDVGMEFVPEDKETEEEDSQKSDLMECRYQPFPSPYGVC